MSNTELCKYYLNLTPVTEMMTEVSFFDIITALDKHFNKNWTWEVADEKIVMDGSMVCTTVTVYIPGRVLTGRSLCKIKDYHESHLRAIVDACNTFTTKSVPVTNPTTNVQVSQQMTPEQIMALANGTNPASHPVDSVPQFDNYKDKNGIPNQGVPLDQMTENCHREIAQEMNFPMNPPVEPEPVINQNSNGIGYNDPNPALKGFSQCQIDKINEFKKEFEIVNDNMFNNYVQAWRPELTSKLDITPSNVDSFIEWAEDFKKKF